MSPASHILVTRPLFRARCVLDLTFIRVRGGNRLRGTFSLSSRMTTLIHPHDAAGQPLSVLLGRRMAILAAIVFAAYICHTLLAVFVSRHLFGDGAWFLLKMLSEGHVAHWHTDLFRDFYVGRYGAFLYHQYPTLLLSQLGITNLGVLAAVYGLTLFSFKSLGLWICHAYADDKRAILFPLTTLFAGTINSEGYVVSETHLFTALFWAAAFMLLTSRRLGMQDLVLLGFISAPLLLCYEAMVLYGPILCALCLYRLHRAEHADRVACRFLIVWYGLGTVFAALSIIHPRDATNRADFLRGMLFVIENDHTGARVSVVITIVVLLILAFKMKPRLLAVLAALAVVLSTAIPLYAIMVPEKLSLNVHVIARTLNAVVPLALTPVFLLWHFGRLSVERANFKAAFLIVSALGAAQVAYNITASLYWNNMVGLLSREVTTHIGIIPLEGTVLARWTTGTAPVRNLHADWPLLPMSIIVAPHGRVTALVDPGSGTFRPFDPYDSTSLPDLQRHGIDYRPYLQTLADRASYHFGQVIHFNTGGNSNQYVIGGWSAPEAWGTWTDGPEATMRINVDDASADDIQMTALAGAFVNERNPQLRVSIIVNEVPAGEWVFRYDKSAYPYQDYSLILKRDVFMRRQPCRVAFRMSKVASPHELGLGGDPRKLGIALVRLTLQPVVPAALQAR